MKKSRYACQNNMIINQKPFVWKETERTGFVHKSI